MLSGHSAQDRLENRNAKGSDYCVGQKDALCEWLPLHAESLQIWRLIVIWAGAPDQDRGKIVLKIDPWISMMGSSLRDYGKETCGSRQSPTSHSRQKKRKSDKALFIFHSWRKREGQKRTGEIFHSLCFLSLSLSKEKDTQAKAVSLLCSSSFSPTLKMMNHPNSSQYGEH